LVYQGVADLIASFTALMFVGSLATPRPGGRPLRCQFLFQLPNGSGTRKLTPGRTHAARNEPGTHDPRQPDFWLPSQSLKIVERASSAVLDLDIHFCNSKRATGVLEHGLRGDRGRLKPWGRQGKQNPGSQSRSEDIPVMVSWGQSAGTALRSRTSLVKPPTTSPAVLWQATFFS
jgi:hypothetical protein